ncbi:MAG: hypothetical protein FVQ84_16630 [Planctomycetes bacterium]|nr:hypothetical protein [Planctomycetota bacterium]
MSRRRFARDILLNGSKNLIKAYNYPTFFLILTRVRARIRRFFSIGLTFLTYHLLSLRVLLSVFLLAGGTDPRDFVKS